MILLEKAWAKIHGSYERIIGGMAHHTIRDLTGAPGYEFFLTDKDAYEKIYDAIQKKYAVCTGVNKKSPDEKEKLRKLGLID